MPSWKSGKDQVSVAALGDQTAIATSPSTRRSALENNPADGVRASVALAPACLLVAPPAEPAGLAPASYALDRPRSLW